MKDLVRMELEQVNQSIGSTQQMISYLQEQLLVLEDKRLELCALQSKLDTEKLVRDNNPG